MPTQAVNPRTRLRALRPDDHAAVQALFQRHGWPQRSRAGWDWALTHNPTRNSLGVEAGWVLEHGSDVVGFLANLPSRYRLNGRSIWGATCSSFLVDASHRAHSMSLLRAFAAQPGAAFLFSATANPNSAPLYKAFKFQPSPLPQSNQRLRWWACEAAVVAHLLDRGGLGSLKPLGRAAATLPALWRRTRRMAWFDGNSPRLAADLQLSRLNPTELRTDAAGPWPHRWDAWAEAFGARAGLWVDRSAATMNWRLSDPDLAAPGDLDSDRMADEPKSRIAVWALHHDDGRIWGTCSARLLPPNPRSPARVELLDWAVMDAFAAVGSAALLDAALDWARGHGAAVVDANRYSGESAMQLAALHPHQAALPDEGVWLLTHPNSGMQEAALWPCWNMTGADSDDWFNTGHRRPNAHARPWAPARALSTGRPETSAPVEHHGVSAADNSATRSEVDCTDAGSKRSMSTV